MRDIISLKLISINRRRERERNRADSVIICFDFHFQNLSRQLIKLSVCTCVRVSVNGLLLRPGDFSVGTRGKFRRRQWPRQRSRHAEQCVLHARLACYAREAPLWAHLSFHGILRQWKFFSFFVRAASRMRLDRGLLLSRRRFKSAIVLIIFNWDECPKSLSKFVKFKISDKSKWRKKK